MKNILTGLLLFLIIVITGFLLLNTADAPKTTEALLTKYKEKRVTKADHSGFAQLNKKFNSPQEVTRECITCHNKRDEQVMNSSHWNWEREEYVPGKGIVYLGKKNAINNFCIAVGESELACDKCHIGFEPAGTERKFTDAENIDCLVCHDNSGTYSKGANMGGLPDPKLDLSEVAKSVGRPGRDNCGSCHFFGGGGNNVKHGDLEKSMLAPGSDIDVHMGTDKADMSCVDCHKTTDHKMAGKMYTLSSMNTDRSYCEDCHTSSPHENTVINEHSLKVACQTCHIPVYAKENYTKVFWDWSTAGKLKDGKPYIEEDSAGNDTYMSIKGSFIWKKNLEPEYIWFNGTATHYVSGEEIKDTTRPLVLNKLYGSYDDPDAKIVPVKIHRAKQPFDPVNRYLIQPKLFAQSIGEGALWKDFNWKEAAAKGMEYVNLPFSGEVSFLNTEMYLPVNHMVSKKEDALRCTDCHTRDNGRLAKLTGFYLPGRDYSGAVETAGAGLITLTLLGVLGHLGMRIYSSRKNRNAKV